MEKFKFLEDIATADIAFQAYGKTLEELFQNAALAVSESMVNTKQIKGKVKKELSFTADTLDNLLFDFLSEIIFLKDSDGLLFSQFDLTITENKTKKLKAVLHGEPLNPQKQELRADVKAVTLHMFEIKKTAKGFEAMVILDI
ncbi:archease [Candidatus Woesearchaeota archaeon]|nr:archease [Candidatus Woesearchaeota archaeon]